MVGASLVSSPIKESMHMHARIFNSLEISNDGLSDGKKKKRLELGGFKWNSRNIWYCILINVSL